MSDNDSSNMESPQSHFDSPYSSPSQQIPQLAYSMTELSCTDSKYMHPEKGSPFLRIVEEPQGHFRFRYLSEMVGTHGCLLGESYGTSKTKTHPTVELVNYPGRAIIRCCLAQYKSNVEHPHRLLEDEQDKDVQYEVPEHGSYKVGFAGMGIIHTAKKDVASLLFKKYSQQMNGSQLNLKDLRIQCENEAKGINLNIVRLMFTAHDSLTGEQICPPVFSKPIHNMKSAATNDLKITRMSRNYGRVSGKEDVFLLVEKVNKKNIKVRLFELNDAGEETWSATGSFSQSDVHHQYAIVFSTPPYEDQQITKERKVYIELVRPSDGRTSEPKEFTYKPLATYKGLGKRMRVDSMCSSYSSSGSLKCNGDVPATVLLMNKLHNESTEEQFNEVQMCTIPQIPVLPQATSARPSDLGEAIMYAIKAEGSPSDNTYFETPMLPQGVAEPPELNLNSTEFERILKDNRSIPAEEKERFCRNDWSDYLKSYSDSIHDENTCGLNIISSMLMADSGRANKAGSSKQAPITPKQETKSNIAEINKVPTEYSAFYKAEDGAEVKKIVKELCEMIREKTGIRKQIVRTKLERLFEMRLSNGDTFLHMTLCSKQPSLDYIVKLINSMKMTHLLNLTNYQSQTILHLAIVYNMPKTVSFLVSKGCNPMIEDNEGNNAIHYAVMCQNCLDPLLDALSSSNVSYDLNATNNENQTALHLAVIVKSEQCVRRLVSGGASYSVRDGAGRTALHLAAGDDCLRAADALLARALPSELNVVDGRGYTALQIVCDGEVRENSVSLVKLLLEKMDVSERKAAVESAWILTRGKTPLRAVLSQYVPDVVLLDDVKSEPEEDYESADEGELVI